MVGYKYVTSRDTFSLYILLVYIMMLYMRIVNDSKYL